MYFRYGKSTQAVIERTDPIRMRQVMTWPRIYCYSADPARTSRPRIWTSENLLLRVQIFALYTQIRYFWMLGYKRQLTLCSSKLTDLILIKVGQGQQTVGAPPWNKKQPVRIYIRSCTILCVFFTLLINHHRRKSSKSTKNQIPGIIFTSPGTHTSLCSLV